MQLALTVLSGLAVLVWVYLLVGHGQFWRTREWLPQAVQLVHWPAVAVLVPARDEAETIERTVHSILGQDYPGRLTLTVVDDQSSDGTAHVARNAAEAIGAGNRLTVVEGDTPPPGWTGKIWAMEQGWRWISASDGAQRWLWLTDADIAHPPDTLRRLVAKGEESDRDLVSLMVRLVAEGGWARLLIPPFVYFFRQLFPFAWVNDPKRGTAAAAGGCMLVRRDAFMAAGGFAAFAGCIIDDCALATAIKRRGRPHGGWIWLGLSDGSLSLRPYCGLAGIWRMVTRSAYAQLRFSPWLLLGTVLAMGLVYLAGPAIVLSFPWHGNVPALGGGLAAWGLMAISILPVLRVYRQTSLWSLALPLTALLYTVMTIGSARAYLAGRGGWWKGRSQAVRHSAVTER
ncbi:glycosyltransferase [Ferruginivarius sediminum]|uniref:Glycosyltransferase n=1 Tax=Ferruginivarius sediminum TaxID=2661937 RepID=A0A369TGI6_9PROT|nr:glycosyltransferase [Ferruginivarius sediminum]RDD63724.1 glycosyltransferase [Ferruginivarius sediminum]